MIASRTFSQPRKIGGKVKKNLRLGTLAAKLSDRAIFEVKLFCWGAVGEAGLLLASSNPRPSHQPYPSPLDPPPIIIHPAKSMRVLCTLSSSPNSVYPPNPGGGLKFVDLQPCWLVRLTLRFGELDIEVTTHYHW